MPFVFITIIYYYSITILLLLLYRWIFHNFFQSHPCFNSYSSASVNKTLEFFPLFHTVPDGFQTGAVCQWPTHSTQDILFKNTWTSSLKLKITWLILLCCANGLRQASTLILLISLLLLILLILLDPRDPANEIDWLYFYLSDCSQSVYSGDLTLNLPLFVVAFLKVQYSGILISVLAVSPYYWFGTLTLWYFFQNIWR